MTSKTPVSFACVIICEEQGIDSDSRRIGGATRKYDIRAAGAQIFVAEAFEGLQTICCTQLAELLFRSKVGRRTDE